MSCIIHTNITSKARTNDTEQDFNYLHMLVKMLYMWHQQHLIQVSRCSRLSVTTFVCVINKKKP